MEIKKCKMMDATQKKVEERKRMTHLNSMFKAVKLPTGISNLDTSLPM